MKILGAWNAVKHIGSMSVLTIVAINKSTTWIVSWSFLRQISQMQNIKKP
jgi:hypothetical protein